MTLSDAGALVVSLICLGWCAFFLASIAVSRRLRLLDQSAAQEPDEWPRLSVIIAARDEADSIQQALSSLCSQDYPNLELVVAEDRSRDTTAEVVRRLALDDPRIRPVHIDQLPHGWLGKVHALHRAETEATGQWLLFTDADVHFAPGVLRKAMALALAENVDHLAVAPGPRAESFATRVAIAAFGTMFLTLTRAHQVGRPGSTAFVGVGAFNLVRREVLARSPGLPWLRMEVADDVGLGYMLHLAGARSAFALSRTAVSLTWYARLPDLVRGLEKNSFGPMAQYSFSRGVAILAILLALNLAPIAALAWTHHPHVWLMGVAAYAAVAVAAAVNASSTGIPFAIGLLVPIGYALIWFTIARSGYRLWRNGGIVWRGSHYSIAELRAGQRVKM